MSQRESMYPNQIKTVVAVPQVAYGVCAIVPLLVEGAVSLVHALPDGVHRF